MAANRKSLRVQIDELNAVISKLAEEEKPAPAKCNLLMTQLETLRYLHAQEATAEIEKLKARITELESAQVPQTTSPFNDSLLDAQVSAMMARHNAGMADASHLQLPVRVTLTRDEPVTPRLAPVEDDPDLLT